MSVRLLILRIAALVAWAVWVGGFVFYAAFVIPILHEALDTEAGYITRDVAERLNFLGAITLLLWWVAALLDPALARPGGRSTLRLLLGASTLHLALLFAGHGYLASHLAQQGLGGFYPRHRVYLVLSTAGFLVNLLLLAQALRLWSVPQDVSSEELPPPGR